MVRHPNDLDRKRIERALEARERYRYVKANIHFAENGYRVEAPCCSRRIDPAGGIVDVALIEYLDESSMWRLHQKNHDFGEWDYYGTYGHLSELLDRLVQDPHREFWQ